LSPLVAITKKPVYYWKKERMESTRFLQISVASTFPRPAVFLVFAIPHEDFFQQPTHAWRLITYQTIWPAMLR